MGDNCSSYITRAIPNYPGYNQRRIQIVATDQTYAPRRGLAIALEQHSELVQLGAHL